MERELDMSEISNDESQYRHEVVSTSDTNNPGSVVKNEKAPRKKYPMVRAQNLVRQSHARHTSQSRLLSRC